ncbi:Hpt domain-containing protein [Vibrio ostreicida]|uniref:Hpt domain-containing protein n=1 Tax=Vibrio ostreicida TaxID=526588 RepID=A0ABT8BQX5_9VIBR|nr:Hpt domain-containing protein [Vibrio ostreicida]MDN3609536.1 Hpt domain-containing protein [Vibrio ostreicida]NPD08412.1 Hpt domain-containing protein [Vibrio ostreicida]
MRRNTLTTGWLVVVGWALGIVLLTLSYRSNMLMMVQVDELGNSIEELRDSLFDEPSYRAQVTNEQGLNLQIIYALRLQLESSSQQTWVSPDVNQLLYTTDRFIDQANAFLENELGLVALVDQIQFVKLKYQDSDLMFAYINQLNANILEALFSTRNNSPEVFRQLDLLYTHSDRLPALEKRDMQQLLAQASLVLGSYAQGSYMLEQLMTHSIRSQTKLVEEQYQSQQTNFVIAGAVYSGMCLLVLCLYVSRLATSQNKAIISVKPIPDELQDSSNSDAESEENVVMTTTPIIQEKAEAEIDIEGMLESLGNDYESVCMLLQVFVDDHAHDVESIRKLLHIDSDEALRKAHSLKGVGGNLGALNLRESASKVELAIKDGADSIPDLLSELTLRLDKAILEAQQFLSQQQN